jgi:CHAD domain-containing protein
MVEYLANPIQTTAWLVHSLARNINQELEQFRKLGPIARADASIEAVHQLRVCVRRVRAILSECSNLIFANTADLLNELRSLSAVLGAVRDLDVVILKFQHLKNDVKLQSYVVRMIHSNLESTRQQLRVLLLKTLDAPRTQVLFKRLEELAQAILLQDQTGNDSQKTESILEKLYQNLEINPKNLEALHTLRKRVKRTRYVLEILEPKLDTVIKKAIKHLRKVQSQLGEINDLAVTLEHLHQMARDSIDLAFVLEPLEDYLEAKLKTSRAEFVLVWKDFDPRVEIQKLHRGLKHQDLN